MKNILSSLISQTSGKGVPFSGNDTPADNPKVVSGELITYSIQAKGNHRQLTISAHTDNGVTGQYSKQYHSSMINNTTLADIIPRYTRHPLQYEWYYITIPCYTVTIH